MCIINEHYNRSVWVQKNPPDHNDQGDFTQIYSMLIYLAAENLLLTSSQFTTDQNAAM